MIKVASSGGKSASDLSALADVAITNPQQGDVLSYSLGTNKWVNNAPTVARVTCNGANVNVPSATPTLLVFDTVVFDSANIFDSADSSFVVTASGYYIVGGTARFNTVLTGESTLDIALNGIDSIRIYDISNASQYLAHHASIPVKLNANDKVQLLIAQNSGTAKSVDAFLRTFWIAQVL